MWVGLVGNTDIQGLRFQDSWSVVYVKRERQLKLIFGGTAAEKSGSPRNLALGLPEATSYFGRLSGVIKPLEGRTFGRMRHVHDKGDCLEIYLLRYT